MRELVKMYYNKGKLSGETTVLPESVSEMKDKGWTTTAPKTSKKEVV